MKAEKRVSDPDISLYSDPDFSPDYASDPVNINPDTQP